MSTIRCTNVDAAVRSGLPASGNGASRAAKTKGATSAIARRVKALVTIGVDGGKIVESALSADFDRITAAHSMAEAVEQYAAIAAPGDAVSGSGLCQPGLPQLRRAGQAFKEAVAT